MFTDLRRGNFRLQLSHSFVKVVIPMCVSWGSSFPYVLILQMESVVVKITVNLHYLYHIRNCLTNEQVFHISHVNFYWYRSELRIAIVAFCLFQNVLFCYVFVGPKIPQTLQLTNVHSTTSHMRPYPYVRYIAVFSYCKRYH